MLSVMNSSTPFESENDFHKFYLFPGGVIEACPPSDSVTALTVNLLIEPDGNTSIISCGDQIHANSPYTCWGLSVPQSSVEPAQLTTACFKVADSCKQRGVMGYLAVDFVTFIDPVTVRSPVVFPDHCFHALLALFIAIFGLLYLLSKIDRGGNFYMLLSHTSCIG